MVLPQPWIALVPDSTPFCPQPLTLHFKSHHPPSSTVDFYSIITLLLFLTSPKSASYVSFFPLKPTAPPSFPSCRYGTPFSQFTKLGISESWELPLVMFTFEITPPQCFFISISTAINQPAIHPSPHSSTHPPTYPTMQLYHTPPCFMHHFPQRKPTLLSLRLFLV